MLGRVPNPTQATKFQRLIRNFKITFLCLFLTAIIICGNPSSRKHSTPDKNHDDIQSTLLEKHVEPRRMLEEIKVQQKSSEGTEQGRYSRADFDINKIYKDEDDGSPEFGRDRSKPYTLGPRISNWDQQRADWLKNNPDFPNFIALSKPRVMLVTGSSPKPCENPVGDHYLLKAIKNKMDYCRFHGMELFYNTALLDAEMTSYWAKQPLVRKLMLTHPEVEFFWWMDSDAMFTDMVFEVPWGKYKDHNMIMHGWDWKIYDKKDWVGLNAGVFIIRNCQWSLDLLDAWVPMGPKGKVRDEAGLLLSKELKDRPAFEADDQSAFVYLLNTQRGKWGDKVYLENSYYLHGYYGILVNRYEEMIENHHPGFGDDRWPLITHFVGCKPCQKFTDGSVERCFQQMDRAFNFADNQILQIYGFSHKSLSSMRVMKIRNETDKPLEYKDELGILYSTFKDTTAPSSIILSNQI